jgi:iron(III) transport system ATP-binding protein
MVAIQIKHLSKRFGDNTVLDRIDLQIQAGEMFFLLGPSGCGKTTLLRHIAGFNLPDEGSVWFGEQEVTRVPPYLRGTAMMFQSYALWPHLTVAENVAFGLEERRFAYSTPFGHAFHADSATDSRGIRPGGRSEATLVLGGY